LFRKREVMMAAAGSNIRISVVIPAYNAARFLPRCLKSVFAQTLKPVEVIVVDDGSTDNTAALAAKLGASVLARPNGGPAAARNAGISKASGEWIALLDADDQWSPEKLERQAARIHAETVLVYTGIRIFGDDGVYHEQPVIDAIAARKMLRYANPIPNSSVLVRREAVVQSGGFREDIRGPEDWEMWFRLLRSGLFAAVAEPLTDYYVYPSSLSANPERMIQAVYQFIDTTLLADLHGLRRWAWRRRILASQLCSAGLIARDNHLSGEFHYMLQSLFTWPSPLWQTRRFLSFAVSAKRSFRRRR